MRNEKLADRSTDDVDIRKSPLLHLGYLGGILVCWIAILILRLTEPAPADRVMSVHGAIDEVAIHGLFDATSHLITALMVAIGILSLQLRVPVWPVLVGGVILDVGHLMTAFGLTESIAGSTRNGTHSVFVVILLALVGFLDQRHANIWLGIAIGAISHLWRDMGTGTVPLAWPINSEVWGTSFPRYMVGLLGVSIAMIGCGALLDVHARAHSNQATGSTLELLGPLTVTAKKTLTESKLSHDEDQGTWPNQRDL